jgi:hypothetical protein
MRQAFILKTPLKFIQTQLQIVDLSPLYIVTLLHDSLMTMLNSHKVIIDHITIKSCIYLKCYNIVDKIESLLPILHLFKYYVLFRVWVTVREERRKDFFYFCVCRDVTSVVLNASFQGQ